MWEQCVLSLQLFTKFKIILKLKKNTFKKRKVSHLFCSKLSKGFLSYQLYDLALNHLSDRLSSFSSCRPLDIPQTSLTYSQLRDFAFALSTS